MAEYPFGMGVPAVGDIREVVRLSKESVEDNPVTRPGPWSPPAGAYPVDNPKPKSAILGLPVARRDGRMRYREGARKG